MSSLRRFVLLLCIASALLLGFSAMAQTQDRADSPAELVPLVTVQVGGAPIAAVGLVRSDPQSLGPSLSAIVQLPQHLLDHSMAAARAITAAMPGPVTLTSLPLTRQRNLRDAAARVPRMGNAPHQTEAAPVTLPASSPPSGPQDHLRGLGA